jgi:hypothetical protein
MNNRPSTIQRQAKAAAVPADHILVFEPKLDHCIAGCARVKRDGFAASQLLITSTAPPSQEYPRSTSSYLETSNGRFWVRYHCAGRRYKMACIEWVALIGLAK